MEAVRAKLEASEEVQSAARKAVHDAKSALKTDQKDAGSSEKEMQGHADKKAILSDLLANEFEATPPHPTPPHPSPWWPQLPPN